MDKYFIFLIYMKYEHILQLQNRCISNIDYVVLIGIVQGNFSNIFIILKFEDNFKSFTDGSWIALGESKNYFWKIYLTI